MLKIIASYTLGITFSLFMAYSVIWNLVHFFYWLKCFKIKTCTSRQCKFKHCCSKWEEVYTGEEKEALLQLVERHRQKLT